MRTPAVSITNGTPTYRQPPGGRPGAARGVRRVQLGVTLLELLVVLVVLGLTAAVVLPSLTPVVPRTDRDPTATLIATARRAAIRRGEPLRLRVDPDGVWALVSVRDGSVVDAGRLSGGGQAIAGLSLSVDGLGSCRPAGVMSGRGAFDPLACRWLASASGPETMSPPHTP